MTSLRALSDCDTPRRNAPRDVAVESGHRLNWGPMNRLAVRWLPPARIMHPWPFARFPPAPEARAQCGRRARSDLCAEGRP
jgi:hypothetical protein